MKYCDPDQRLPSEESCYPRNVTDKWIQDIQIETWVQQELINFNIFGKKPTDKMHKYVNTINLDSEKSTSL